MDGWKINFKWGVLFEALSSESLKHMFGFQPSWKIHKNKYRITLS